MIDYYMNLAIFDGEGGGGDAGSGAAAPGTEAGTPDVQKTEPESKPKKTSLKDVQYGKPEPNSVQDEPIPSNPSAEPTAEEKHEAERAEFEKYLKDHKEFDQERIQKIINSRFAETKSLKEKADSYEPIMDMLREKYGTDDISEIEDKLRYDDESVEQRAIENGLTIEQQRTMDGYERELAQLRKSEEDRQREERAREIRADWIRQGDALKQQYPDFDLQYESTNENTGERFRDLLARGIDVKNAFELIHMDEIMNNAIARTAQAVQSKMVNDIKSRGQRPAENGGNATAPSVISKPDPAKWTKKDREEVSRRVLRGDKIFL